MHKHNKSFKVAKMLAYSLAVGTIILVGGGGLVHPISAYAAEVIETWDSGNTTVTLNGDIMTVSPKTGTDGKMLDYSKEIYSNFTNKYVREIIVEDGVTQINSMLFESNSDKNALYRLKVSDTLEKISTSTNSGYIDIYVSGIVDIPVNLYGANFTIYNEHPYTGKNTNVTIKLGSNCKSSEVNIEDLAGGGYSIFSSHAEFHISEGITKIYSTSTNPENNKLFKRGSSEKGDSRPYIYLPDSLQYIGDGCLGWSGISNYVGDGANLTINRIPKSLEYVDFTTHKVQYVNLIDQTNDTIYLNKVQGKLILGAEGKIDYYAENHMGLNDTIRTVVYLGESDALLGLNIKSLKSIYWLGGIDSSMTKDRLCTAARIFCIKDSDVETWCKNNSVAYTLLSDEEVEEITKGTLPTLEQSSKLFDADNPKDITYTVSLGTKPAGATGITNVIIDNIKLSTQDFEFNGVDKITVKKDYLSTLKNGEHTVSVLFNNDVFKSGAGVIIIGSAADKPDTPPVILDTIKYEFYKDYPDYVVIPYALNRADEIKTVEIEKHELTNDEYQIEKSTIVINKDYLASLEVGKYRVHVTFDDGTVLSNAQIIVYEKAADRAAPYLLQSRIVFDGSPILMTFDPGEGDLESHSVLALVLDDDIILPNGDKLPFIKTNVIELKQAFEQSLEIDEPFFVEDEIAVATPSEATPSEATKKEEDESEAKDTDDKIEVATPSVATPSEAIPEDKDSDTDKSEIDKVEEKTETNDTDDKIENEETDKVEENTDTNDTSGKVENEKTDKVEEKTDTNDSDDSEEPGEPGELDEKLSKLDVVQSTLRTGSKGLIDETEEDEEEKLSPKEKRIQKMSYILADVEYNNNNVFNVNGNQIELDANYVESLNLEAGDHLIGAVFDNTEKTTDIKKVILTIEAKGGNIKPDDEEGSNSSSGGSSGGGSHSGGSSGGGGGHTTKPDKDTTIKTDVPDTGGNWSGSGEDWTYIKPDGSIAKEEWVGDGVDYYYIDSDGKLKFDWFCDKDGRWYMLNRDHNGKFGAALRGWYFEKQDNNWYYLEPKSTAMVTGWNFIDNNWYYFNINTTGATYVGDNINGWKFIGNEIKPHGSMLLNTITPDGYKVNEKGIWIR